MKNKKVEIPLFNNISIGEILWIILIILKAIGLVDIGWFWVLTGFFWIPILINLGVILFVFIIIFLGSE